MSDGSIILYGDVFLGGLTGNKLQKIKIESASFHKASLNILNLEGPIGNLNTVSDKSILLHHADHLTNFFTGDNMVALLANNHMHDAGKTGLSETINVLQSLNIRHIGAGINDDRAGQPIRLSNKLSLFNFCQFGQKYLSDVKVAGKNSWGVNGFELETVLDQLDQLPPGHSAIITIHWGAEHIFMPPPALRCIMEKLLEHDRVLTVVGNHPHRIQGVVRHKKKIGFFSQGNFFFTDFVIKPPIVSIPIDTSRTSNYKFKTYQYLKVFNYTLKRWNFINRLSVGVRITKDEKIETIYFLRKKDNLRVIELGPVSSIFLDVWLMYLSMFFYIPKKVYNIFFIICYKVTSIKWKVFNRALQCRQLGFLEFSTKVMRRLIYKEYF